MRWRVGFSPMNSQAINTANIELDSRSADTMAMGR